MNPYFYSNNPQSKKVLPCGISFILLKLAHGFLSFATSRLSLTLIVFSFIFYILMTNIIFEHEVVFLSVLLTLALNQLTGPGFKVKRNRTSNPFKLFVLALFSVFRHICLACASCATHSSLWQGVQKSIPNQAAGLHTVQNSPILG